jgi:hypothetical protein
MKMPSDIGSRCSSIAAGRLIVAILILAILARGGTSALHSSHGSLFPE